MHITSLPGKFGIGDFGPQAYRFADSLVQCGVRFWQMLPLGPTGYGNSPYSARSTFAGNELLISPELLLRDGLLSSSDLSSLPRFPETKVDFGAVTDWKMDLLRKTARTALQDSTFRTELDGFVERNSFWIRDYALFMLLYGRYRDARWHKLWDRLESIHDDSTCRRIAEENIREIEIWEALQLIFEKQCKALMDYVHAKGLLTIGDIPIFVGEDSADAWSHPELFKRDGEGRFSDISGVPPDNFSSTGQLWGTPVYDWDYHKRTGFDWWIRRIRRCFELNDVLRIDHFRGFDAYYDLPAGSKTAEHGTWIPAPGKALFNRVRKELGKLPIIAEDLGNITDQVIRLRLSNGFPGMKIAQFGFGFGQDGIINESDEFLPPNYDEGYVAYTGTHDNDTTRGWFDSLSRAQKEAVLRYLETDEKGIVDALVSSVMNSRANIAVIPMQDILGLDGSARMNYPSTCNDVNWSWRMKDGAFSDELISGFRTIVKESDRITH